MPSSSLVANELAAQTMPVRIGFDASELTGWDSALISFLVAIYDFCRARGIKDDRTGLPALFFSAAAMVVGFIVGYAVYTHRQG